MNKKEIRKDAFEWLLKKVREDEDWREYFEEDKRSSAKNNKRHKAS